MISGIGGTSHFTWEQYTTYHYAHTRHHPQSPAFSSCDLPEFVVDVYTSVTRATSSPSAAWTLAKTVTREKVPEEYRDQLEKLLAHMDIDPRLQDAALFSGRPWRTVATKIADAQTYYKSILGGATPDNHTSGCALLNETLLHIYCVHQNMRILFGKRPYGVHDACKLNWPSLEAMYTQFWPKPTTTDVVAPPAIA